MKKLILPFLALALVACAGKSKVQRSDVELVHAFLSSPKSLIDASQANPITAFQNGAVETADQIIKITINNMEEVLVKAKEYKYCVITTSNHTILLIDNLSDCKNSNSWKTCMPHGKGYIKKGELEFKADYANNIIGRPDDQERTVYLFN